MPDFKLTQAAKMDLREISAYTKKTWGREQEKAYREIIRAALRLLAKTPEIGPKRDELTEGLRSFPVGHHLTYYVEKADGIVVARILHPAMDRESALQNLSGFYQFSLRTTTEKHPAQRAYLSQFP